MKKRWGQTDNDDNDDNDDDDGIYSIGDKNEKSSCNISNTLGLAG